MTAREEIASALDDLAQVYPTLDRQIQRMLAVHKDPPSCAGCRTASCCYQATLVFLGEGLHLANVLRPTRAQRHELRRSGLTMEQATRAEHFAARRPCPYLDVGKGECTIYEHRPQACRRYFVATPRELCDPRLGPNRKVGMFDCTPIDAQWVDMMFGVQLSFGLGIPPVMLGSLPRMVAICDEALDQPDYEAFQRFLLKQDWLEIGRGQAALEED